VQSARNNSKCLGSNFSVETKFAVPRPEKLSGNSKEDEYQHSNKRPSNDDTGKSLMD